MEYDIDGKAVDVILDTQGGVLSIYSPYYTDPAGNPMVISFGYGQDAGDPVGLIKRLIAILGFK